MPYQCASNRQAVSPQFFALTMEFDLCGTFWTPVRVEWLR